MSAFFEKIGPRYRATLPTGNSFVPGDGFCAVPFLLVIGARNDWPDWHGSRPSHEKRASAKMTRDKLLSFTLPHIKTKLLNSCLFMK